MWSDQGSDRYTGVAARMITNLQKLVTAWQEGTADPFVEAETASYLGDRLCVPKGFVGKKGHSVKSLEKALPQRPEPEVQRMMLEESVPLQTDDLLLEPETPEEERVLG